MIQLICIGCVVFVLLGIWQVFVHGMTIGTIRLVNFLEPNQPLGKQWPAKVFVLSIILVCGATILNYIL